MTNIFNVCQSFFYIFKNNTNNVCTHSPLRKYVYGWNTSQMKLGSPLECPLQSRSLSTSSKAAMRVLQCRLGFCVLYQLSDTTTYPVGLDKMPENQPPHASVLKRASALLRYLQFAQGSAGMVHLGVQ